MLAAGAEQERPASACVAEAMSSSMAARELGARGSKISISHVGAASDLPDTAAAVLAAVPRWWHARAAAVGLSGQWLDVTRALAVESPELPGPTSAGLPDVGVTGESLGGAYVSALSPHVRARHGRHYTPPDLAEQLWAMTRRALGHGAVPRRLTGLVRDPACGAGALLLPPLREHLSALRRSAPEMILASLSSAIEGVDSDPAAVWLANVVLAAEGLPALAAVPESRRRPLGALVRTGDGLAATRTRASAVVMNPPYGRVRLDSIERERFASFVYGHANLYGLFLAAGMESLDERGVLSALVPTSLTSGRYFASLRAALTETAPLRELTFVAERGGVFSGVLQETCLATFTRSKRRKATVFSSNGHLTAVAKVRSPRGSGPWLLPRRADDAPVAAAAATMPLTLASAGWRVSTGPLVWNRRKADLQPQPASGRLPVLWAADIDGGRLHRDPARDGLRYLRIRDDADRAVMALSEPAIVVQRTSAPEQARRIVAVDLGPGELARWGGAVVVENHVNVLRPTCTTPAIERATLARVLSTPTMDRVMRCLAGSVAVSAYELLSLPLPGIEQLTEWASLTGTVLDAEVRSAYQPGSA